MLRPLIASLIMISSAAASAEVPQLIEDWLDQQKSEDSFTAGFTQTKSGGMLKSPRQTPGRIWKAQTGEFRWELGQPARSILVFDGTQLHSYSSRNSEWKKLRLSDRRYKHLLAFLGVRPIEAAKLCSDFQVTETARTTSLVTFALQPQIALMRKKIAQIDLQIDPRNHRLKQVRILGADESTTLVTLSHIEPLKQLDGLFSPSE